MTTAWSRLNLQNWLVAGSDAHWGNVMIVEGTEGVSVKLLDFGTSIFRENEVDEGRHWKIVYQTFLQIVGAFPGLREYGAELKQRWDPSSSPHLWISIFDDLLNYADIRSGRYAMS